MEEDHISTRYGRLPAATNMMTNRALKPSLLGCGSQLCDDSCSLDSCTQACDASDVCEDFTVCSRTQCHDLVCSDNCSSASGYCQSVAEAFPDAGQIYSDSEPFDAIHCPWVLPGEPCDVTVETKQALGQHINQEHIDPLSTLVCPWKQCTEIVDRQSIPNHLFQQHQPEQHKCPWNHCARSFVTCEELYNHVLSSHGELDCRFGGCEVTSKDLLQLKTHVNEDHLNLADFHEWPSSSSIVPKSDPSTYTPQESSPYTNVTHASNLQNSQSYWSSFSGLFPMHSPNSPHYLQDQLGAPEFSHLACNAPSQRFDFVSNYHDSWQTSSNARAPPVHVFEESPPSHDDPHQGDLLEMAGGVPESHSRSIHTCLWMLDLNTPSTCGRRFDDTRQLQEHIDKDHIFLKKSHARSEVKTSANCCWKDCRRSRDKGPLSDLNKLSRHMLTHTNCKNHPLL